MSRFILENEVRPEILTHPNIPKPLHGTAPRVIKGQNWWDEVRQRSYAKNNYCCWACGQHKTQDKFHSWLEAHEYYDIDYEKGIVRLKEIVALCHSCHSFIHSGRLLGEYQAGNITKEKSLYILRRGIRICIENSLKPFFVAYFDLGIINGYSEEKALQYAIERGWYVDEENVPWDKWKMIIEGKEYYSRFKNIEEWKKEYIGE